MKGITKEVFNEAVGIVAHDHGVSRSFVVAAYDQQKIMRLARSVNRKRESKMDSIREEW